VPQICCYPWQWASKAVEREAKSAKHVNFANPARAAKHIPDSIHQAFIARHH
jgi:hypothetical protein